MGDRSGVNVYRELVNDGAAAARKAAKPVTEAEPEPDPPSAEEVANAQHQLAEEFTVELRTARSASRVQELAADIFLAFEATTLRKDQVCVLAKLVDDAQKRLSKV